MIGENASFPEGFLGMRRFLSVFSLPYGLGSQFVLVTSRLSGWAVFYD